MTNLIRDLKNSVKGVRATWRRASVARRLPARQVSAEPAVVVAPHPDDETFGAGGMIALKRALDVPVSVIWLTDGSASLRSFPEVLPEEVGRVRRDQALAACAHLGLSPGHVMRLGLPDGGIPDEDKPGFEDAVARLTTRLEPLKAGEIYCPHPRDAFPDHEAAASIALAAASRLGSPDGIIFYVVWAWFNAQPPLRRQVDLRAGWQLDIRSVYGQKQAAVAEYLDSRRTPGGHPYCGYLPRAVTRSATARSEIFFDHAADNLGPCMAVRQTGTSA